MRLYLFTYLRIFLVVLLSVAAGTPLSHEASAQTTCVRATNRVVKGKVTTSLSTTTRSGNCRRGEVAAVTGPTGATGATGTDGQLRVYGDGSSGALTISSTQTFTDASPMYTDVVINSGSVFSVPSGTVIRCTGSFTNNGTVTVLRGASGGRNTGIDSTTIMSAYALPHQGASSRAATSGESGDTSALRTGGFGGVGLSLFEASTLRYPGPYAGGGGGGGFSVTGGQGGGSLVVLCGGAVTNNGSIIADGEDITTAAGGGGGGIVILASKTSVTSSAGSSVVARGGDAGVSSTSTSPGGGGGGGVIHFMAPTIDVGSATTSVAGGVGGAIGVDVSSNPRAGGPGGGGSGGNGGNGGSIPSGGNTPGAGSSGSTGHIISTTVDPTSLF